MSKQIQIFYHLTKYFIEKGYENLSSLSFIKNKNQPSHQPILCNVRFHFQNDVKEFEELVIQVSKTLTPSEIYTIIQNQLQDTLGRHDNLILAPSDRNRVQSMEQHGDQFRLFQ